MFGSGGIFSQQGAAVNPVLLDRVSNNQTYTAYEDYTNTHTDDWTTNQRHQFDMDSNQSGPYWCNLIYDLDALGLDINNYTDVEVRCFSGTVPTRGELQIVVGLSDGDTAFDEPASGNRATITFSAGSSITYIFRTLAIDGLTNYGTAGYHYLWVGYLYGPERNQAPAAMPSSYYYNIELKV